MAAFRRDRYGVFSVTQIGPLPVLAAAVLWLYWTGSTGAAIGLVVLSLPVIMLDNVLRRG